MSGVRRTAATVYEFTIQPRVCDCPGEPFRAAVGRNLDRITQSASGYWAVWQAFFGDQLEWLLFQVIDVRDGQILWQNGQPTKEAHSGQLIQ